MADELPKIRIELGELDHAEVTGVKIVQMLKRLGQSRVVIEISGHLPGMITSASKHDGDL